MGSIPIFDKFFFSLAVPTVLYLVSAPSVDPVMLVASHCCYSNKGIYSTGNPRRPDLAFGDLGPRIVLSTPKDSPSGQRVTTVLTELSG